MGCLDNTRDYLAIVAKFKSKQVWRRGGYEKGFLKYFKDSVQTDEI